MTKSTITRERLEKIASGNAWVCVQDDEAAELARMALAAMDSEAKEPISFDEWSRKCALQITLCYPDFREKAKYIWDSARETQQPAPKYPEVLPCSVLLEPGLRFGKGIKTSTMLAALARRAAYESDMAVLSPEEKAEFQAGIEDFKALIAHPVPVVPQDVLEALQKVARIRLDMNDFDGDRRGIADCLCDAEEALIEVVNRRADMLQGGSSPAQSDCCPAQNSVAPAQNQGWIPVSERMPESNGVYFGWDGKRVLEVYCFFGGFSANQFIHGEITHWMPLPAAPQEVK
ncbi:TPA: DUF551 domain-containing protein [Klebsiella pneumoniae]|nr:DUF551 domain-containing protein [Klebsiella pneumoniae]HDZ8985476.1 DUF551 domain-containing protein [Klebsiella pneumoniae]